MFQLKAAPSLHFLDLSQNKLSKFPEIPSSVTDLKISKNEIKDIPHDMQLPNLKNLDLSENQITAAPKSVGGLKLKSKCAQGHSCDSLTRFPLLALNMKKNPLKDKKLFKYIDQNQALKAIMDHISKLGIASPVSVVNKEENQKEPEPEKLPKANKIVIKKYDENLKFIYDPSVKDVRSHIVCCIINNTQLTEVAIKEFLQFQTKLHEGICKKRESATIATHDLGMIASKTLRYAAKNKNDIRIQPLGRSVVITATEYYNKLRSEADTIRKDKKRSQFTGIYKYLHLLDNQENFAFFETDTGTTLSLPPLTNSDVTKLSTNTKRILIEVTSSIGAGVTTQVMSQLLAKALEMNLSPSNNDDHVLEVEQVRFDNIDGNFRSVFPSKVDLEELENDTTQVIRP